MTFAEKVIQFNKQLDFKGTLPPGISVMNPYRNNPDAVRIMEEFYTKYYNDDNKRHLILGINPGRFGAGVTGIPFTDSKRLKAVLDINYEGKETHEPSSVFIYEMIAAFGGPEAFYKRIYINSMFPLGFTATNAAGKEVNYNYYDSKALTDAVYDLIVSGIRKQLQFGLSRKVCYCMGTGKNAAFLQALNEKEGFFEQVVPLEHPRFVMQYKAKTKQAYVDKYLEAFEMYQP